RSHRRAADGVVAQATRFTNAFRSIACERPPRPRLFSERIHFANGASTPPLQGGECTYPKSVSNMKWDTTLARSPKPRSGVGTYPVSRWVSVFMSSTAPQGRQVDASGAGPRLKLVVKSNPQGSRPGLRYNAASR